MTVQDLGTGTVLHVPPPADTLPAHLEALLRFANAGDDGHVVRPPGGARHHPALRLGWLHPFVDGNGRTARALFYWSMLRRATG